MSETAVVTLLFTDLVGSTELSQRLGEDGAEVLRREHTQVLRDAIEASGGREVKHMGDGLMVVFVSPSDAARCAIAMQQGVDKHSRRLPHTLGLRVGFHLGEVTKEQNDYFGTAVVVAERLCKRAEGGQIFTSDVLRALVGTRGGHVFKELGPLDLKGIDEPVTGFELHWEPSSAERIPFPGGFPEVDRLLFVGREDERERIQAVWKRAMAGRRQLALVAGEPGIGKTRLTTELALDAHEQGAVVLFGRCDEELGIPYQPFAEAARHYVAHCPLDELRAHVADHGGEISRLAPELHKRLPDVPKPESGDSADVQGGSREEDRHRLFEATASLIEATSSDASVLLVLDDLHWATKPTLLLLRHLLRRTEPSRLLIVGTYRDTDLARTHPFADMLADLRREMDVERISLSGLDEDGVASFVARVSEQEVGDAERALVHAVHAETEGNPFFVGQVLRHLIETRALYEKEGRWTYDGPVDRLGIPEGVREVIGRRMSRLSESANRALGVASVIGVEFELALLERVPDASVDGDVLDALDEAVRARIVDEVPDAPGRFRFTHTLIRQTLYEELTSARRVRLHERVGEAIETLHADDPARLPSLARHFGEAARSGNVEKAAVYAVRAARSAIDRCAYEEAIELAEAGLQCLEIDDSSHHVARADLHLLVAEAWTYMAEPYHGREAALAAADAARAGSAPDRLAWAAFWFVPNSGGAVEQAYALCAEALGALGDQQPSLRALMLSNLVVAGVNTGRIDDLGASIREAVDLATEVADPRALVMAWFVQIAWSRSAIGPSTLRLDEADLAMSRYFELAEPFGAGWVLDGVGLELSLDLIRGERAGYEAGLERHDQLSAQARSPYYVRSGISRRVTSAMLDGRFADASRLVRDQTMSTGAGVAPIQLYYLLTERGRRVDPEQLRPGVDAFPHLSGYRATFAHAVALAGADDEARTQLDIIATNDFEQLRHDFEASSGLAQAVYTCAVLGESRFASRLYELGLPQSGRILIIGGAAVALGAADRFLGMLAALVDDFDAAERHFDAAIELEERLLSPPLAARTRYWYAWMLRRHDTPERADELLDECIAVADELGMAGLEADARGLHS